MKNKHKKNMCIELAPNIAANVIQVPITPCLERFVKSITIETEIKTLTSAPYQVLPDTAIVMGFQYTGHLYLVDKHAKKQLKQSGISGLQTSSRLFQPADNTTKTILVKFYPWAMTAFFSEASSVFTNQALGLADVINSSIIQNIEEQLFTAKTSLQLAEIIQKFLIQLQLKAKPSYSLDKIKQLAQVLMINPKIKSVAMFAKQYGYSTRSLERHFKENVGLSPKQFLRLARFQKIVQELRAEVPIQTIIENYHYYDQAHLLNEFKTFSNMTPGQFISGFAPKQ